MPFLPSPVMRTAARRRTTEFTRGARLCGVALLCPFVLVSIFSCTDRTNSLNVKQERDSIADGRRPVAWPMGNLRIGRAPTSTEVVLSEFLFGTSPEPMVNFVKPVDICPAAGGILIGDGALAAVLFLNQRSAELSFTTLRESPRAIAAMTVAPDGDLLIADANAHAVLRFSATGDVVRRYVSPTPDSFRPSGVAIVGDELWVSNVAAHRIDVFDAQSASWLRAIGKRGRGNGEFGFPLDLARLRDGHIAVVDMLNCRVQVLDSVGRWVRNIGGPGDAPGHFGRPRTLAVGPDGTIFVTDAATQRVHAFSPQGRVLGTFGGPEFGADPLVLPAGIAVVPNSLASEAAAPDSLAPKYTVLVAEQLLRPGIRAYAWLGPEDRPITAASTAVGSLNPDRVASPHWNEGACNVCHTMNDGAIRPIAAADVDRGCLSCHDGKKAANEAHPIGRVAAGPQTKSPDGWPLIDGRLTCMTCHDIAEHCDPTPQRSPENPAFVRAFNPEEPMASCRTCHIATEWRVNPHQRVESNTCGFCHKAVPSAATDGRRRGVANLHTNDSRICLGCHTAHADPAPRGHLGAVVKPDYAANIQRAAELLSRDAADSADIGELLPLADSKITCFTCHNPHSPALFPPDSELGRRTSAEGRYAFNLRLNQTALCITCHGK